MSTTSFRIRIAAAALCAGLMQTAPAADPFGSVPSPVPPAAELPPSQAESDMDYRGAAARHIYASYPTRIYKGKLPPMLYGVAIVEAEVDAEGKVTQVKIRRPPAAPEIGPWLVALIKKASPFPSPAKMGRATYVDVWLVDRSGNFQLDTLTEGQR
jgi:TonB family protein